MAKTRSERLFEDFLKTNSIAFDPIPVAASARPDYVVRWANIECVFEVKEIVTDRAWNDDVGRHGTVGEHLRKLINSSKRQVQAAAQAGKPTVLLVFNNYDPLQLFGTEDHDYRDAMLGAYSLSIGVETRKIYGSFHGAGCEFQVSKNTSFSALGRLKQGRNKTRVTLFPNRFAKVQLPIENLPPCFEVVHLGPSAASA